jgi:hypothetical protein
LVRALVLPLSTFLSWSGRDDARAWSDSGPYHDFPMGPRYAPEINKRIRPHLKRRVKYLNNVIEQDHRFIKNKVRASQCFKRFSDRRANLRGDWSCQHDEERSDQKIKW